MHVISSTVMSAKFRGGVSLGHKRFAVHFFFVNME